MANTQDRVFVPSILLSKSRFVICSLLLLFAASVNAQDTVFRYSADSPSESNASGTDIYQVLTTTGAALGDVLKLSGTASQNTGLDIRGAYLDFTIQSDTPGVVRTIKKTNNAGRFYNFNEASGTNAAMTLKDLSIQGSDSEIGNVIGIFLHNSTPNSRYDVTIDNVTFSGFKNSGYKGAVFDFTRGDLYMTVSNGLTFDSNKTTAAYGGAFDMENSGRLTITGDSVIFNNNSAKSYGGAIHGSNTTITANVVKFTNNTANEEFGGAVNLYNGTLTITGQGENPTIEISGNSAAKLGGAIRGNSAFSNGAFTFANNTAGTNGGAIYCDSITFSGDDTSAAFTGNTASGSGNDLYVNGSSGTVLSFTDGGTYSFDGGIYVNNSNAQIAINKAQVTIAGRANDSTNVYQLQNVTISNGGKLTANLDNIDTLTGAVNLGAAGSAGSIELNAGQGVSKTLSSIISGAGSLTKTGAGNVTLDAYNTYTGGTTVTAGTLTLNKTGEAATLAPGSAVTVNGSTAVLAGHGDILGYNTGAIGSLTLMNGGTFKNDATNTHITINNVVYMNNGTIYATGAGHNQVGNFNIDNAIHVTGGTNNAITATKFNLRKTTAVTFLDGDYSGKIDVASGAKLTINSKIMTNSSATLTKTGAGTLAFSSAEDQSIAVNVVINEGTLVLTNGIGAKTRFMGTVTVNSGAKLQCDAGDSIGYGGGATTFNLFGGTLHLNGHNETIRNATVNLKGGSITSTGSDANHAFGINQTGTTFHALAADGATTSSPTVSTVSSPISLRNSETFSVTVDEKAKLVFSGGVMDGYGVTNNSTITKKGAGVLQLSGANTYTKGTIIEAGTVAINNVGGLGTGAVTVNGGTLDASGAGVNNFANAIVIGSNGGTVTTATGDYSSFASISGTGNLTTNGYVHFNGTGGYSGNVTVNSGYTRITPGAFGVFNLTLNNSNFATAYSSGTIQIGKLNSPQGDKYLFATGANYNYVFEIGVNTSSTDESSFGYAIRGSANGSYNVTIKKVGAGTQTFNRNGYGFMYNNHEYAQNSIKEVIVDSGKMIIDANNNKDFTAGGTTGYWGSAPITINAGGTLQYQKAWTTSANVSMTINGGTLTLNASEYLNKITFNSGTVNGSGQLRVGYVGTANWTVTGGTSTINNNVYVAKNGSYTTFTINIADGATLDAKKNIAGLSTHTGTNLVINGSGTAGTGKIKLYGVSGSTMTGLGTVKFNNINVEMSGSAGWLGSGFFNGSAVTLTNSTLTTSTPHTTNGTVFTLDNSTLTFNGKINSYIHEITLKNGSNITGATTTSQFRTGHNWNSKIITQYVSGDPQMNTISADIVMHDPSKTMTFDIADKAPLTFSGKFIPADPDNYSNDHNNSMIKTGAGEMTLTQPLANVGNVAINQGTLTLSAGGTLNNLSGSGVLNYGESALTLNNAANSTFSGDILGSGTVTKSAAGTLTLSKEPEYTGATVVEQGTLALADGGTLYNLSGGSLDENGEIAVAATLDATGKALTLDNSETTKFIGSIKADSIEKTGDGTLQIYASAAGQVDAGHFLVSSGRLDMKEYYKGTMQVKSGATMSPGNSVGTLTIDGAFILDSAATLLIEQDATGMDKLTASSFTVSPDSILELTYGGGSGSYDILVQNDGDFTGDYATNAFWNGLLTPGSAYYWNLSVNGNVVTASIDANAVPEPSTWALLILGVVALLLRKRVSK